MIFKIHNILDVCEQAGNGTKQGTELHNMHCVLKSAGVFLIYTEKCLSNIIIVHVRISYCGFHLKCFSDSHAQALYLPASGIQAL